MEYMTCESNTSTRTDNTSMTGERFSPIDSRAHQITDQNLQQFTQDLQEREKTPSTIAKYCRDVAAFRTWLKSTQESPQNDFPVNKDKVKQYKQYLKDNYKLSSANSMLSALNVFFKSMGWYDCCVAAFKTQRAAFRSTEKDLSVQEYQRLLKAANARTGRGERGGRQLALIMETLAGTGIRISELPFITVASLSTRRAAVSLKGKSRVILLPALLCKKLRAYCRARSITEGSIFVTRTGRPLDRTNILHRMKALSTLACVLRDKIFPHNLRHLFAVTYYEKEKDIVRLADLLGHSNINTTRIYTLVSCETQLDILDRIGDLLAPA